MFLLLRRLSYKHFRPLSIRTIPVGPQQIVHLAEAVVQHGNKFIEGSEAPRHLRLLGTLGEHILHRQTSEIRKAPRSGRLTYRRELEKLIFRYAEVDEAIAGF
jgi:hypothetical protein